MTKEKQRVSAAELMAVLQRDPTYKAREAEKEHARFARIAANREAAAPIVGELVAAGFAVSTVADLHNKRLDYPAAIPILLSWLPKVRNVDLKQDIVRCLSVPYAKRFAARPLIEEYRRAEDSGSTGLRWVIGNALEVLADDAVVDEMIELASDRRYGRAREMLVAGLGNIGDERVIALLLDLLKDDEVSGHAIVARGKLAPQAARTHVEPFLKHPRAWVRKEAKKTIGKPTRWEAAFIERDPRWEATGFDDRAELALGQVVSVQDRGAHTARSRVATRRTGSSRRWTCIP